ncbi:hypothetical protein DPEC_G00293640 [Dallia pectoralis]|uniref:Uncharacterized protein n=1 Tax=Dallia pectoralis TaxID=75939 RepID=A0ACC2FI97_DALPE|nr:hypothetical protein DPEC_G00293640 [Dallia pectoralis]
MDHPVNSTWLGTINSTTGTDLTREILTIAPVLPGIFTQAGVGNVTSGGEENRGPKLVRNAEENPVSRDITVAAQALVLLTIFLLSSLGNSAVVIVIIKHRQLRTVTNAFIVSLSLSDFLTAVLCLPFSFVMLFSRDGAWMFGERICVANGFLNTCFGIISTLTMTVISLDRYYAIVRQPREKIGRRRAMHLLVAVWLTALLFSIPWYLFIQTSNDPVVVHKRGFYHCMYVFHSGTSRMGTSYSIALMVVCYLLPFGLMCFCHYNICRTVRLSEVRVRPVTTYAYLIRFYSEMRTATTVLIMIVFIICCWGPYCLMCIVTAAGGYTFSPIMDTVAIWMAWANGAINPLIYAIRNPNISILLGRSREEGYRTTQTQRRDVRTRADRIRDRYVKQGTSSWVSSSSPANGGEVAMWACRTPAVVFCRDARPDHVSEPAVPKDESLDTSL